MSKSRFLSFLNCCFQNRNTDEEDDERAMKEEREEIERMISERNKMQINYKDDYGKLGKSPDDILKELPIVNVSQQLIKPEYIREDEIGKIDFVLLNNLVNQRFSKSLQGLHETRRLHRPIQKTKRPDAFDV